MKKQNIILPIFLLIINTFSVIAQKHITVIDDDAQTPISFASVRSNDKYFQADIDGVLRININTDQKYTFSCVGYEKIEIAGNDLMNMPTVKMKILPTELNPVIVTVDKALNLLEQYVANTYQLIPNTPFYLKIYEKAQITDSKDTLIYAKAILVSKINRKNKVGKGVNATTKIMGLSIFNNGTDVKDFATLSYYPPSINRFLVNERKTYDQNLMFYIFDSNDSICIIGYKPKKEYKIQGNTVLTSGKFYIDKQTETIIRMDSRIEPSLLVQASEIQRNSKNKNHILKSFSRTIQIKNGLPLKIKEETIYHKKNSDSNREILNSVEQVYHLSTKNDFEKSGNQNAQHKSIAYQSSFSAPDFEKEYNEVMK